MAVVGLGLDYLAVTALFAIGLYVMVAKDNLIKKLLGLNVMQTAVFAFLLTAGMIEGGDPPLRVEGTEAPFASPIPQAMVLTGIVVAVAVTAVALALIVRIHAHYGTIELGEIRDRP